MTLTQSNSKNFQKEFQISLVAKPIIKSLKNYNITIEQKPRKMPPSIKGRITRLRNKLNTINHQLQNLGDKSKIYNNKYPDKAITNQKKTEQTIAIHMYVNKNKSNKYNFGV